MSKYETYIFKKIILIYNSKQDRPAWMLHTQKLFEDPLAAFHNHDVLTWNLTKFQFPVITVPTESQRNFHMP